MVPRWRAAAPHPTLIITEDTAFSSPYFFTESGALPMFRYRADQPGGLYARLQEDAERLFELAVPVAAEDFP